ncbi:class I SAM-dependent methyltransferase [Streptomyces fuscichromogenes]|uniref:class I SAM-dependent methyltransferase n=1 Tax=Streptomyces fuscichromogenes TaxID=1324013 RepID=UPI0037F4B294
MPTGAGYLPSASLHEYMSHAAAEHPGLHDLIDPTRARSPRLLTALVSVTNEFDSDETGRGDSYRRAQRDASVRWTGAQRLLQLATRTDSPGDVTLLDVLGGDGTIARAVADRADSRLAKLYIITGDISGEMVARALAQGLPAVRQSADALLLKDASVDATLLAYGTHHIAPADRPQAVSEAVRVVRPGGRVVLHDFDTASPMARFFTEVVHPYSAAGHDYTHFSRAELTTLFAGLPVSTTVLDVYDPLIVEADDRRTARARMCRYIADMYGVREVFAAHRDAAASWAFIEEIFDHSRYAAGPADVPPAVPLRPVLRESGSRWFAEVPRMAIVAVAEKRA